jgi:sugar lactone lactonase YvrE
MGLRHGALRAVLIAGVVLLGLPGAAGAYTTAASYQASDYATGLPEKTANDWGPIGIAFDRSDNLYVADTADGNIYRFQPGGGTASAATRLTPAPIPGTISGLVVSSSGEIYLARYRTGDIVEVDPGTGEVTRTVASVQCATGLAIDPVSGDLFVSQDGCGSTIFRVSPSSGAVSSFASAPGVDGLAFDQSGTLYAESGGHVLRIDGTQSSSPGTVTSIARVPQADGLAFGAHSTGQPPYLVVNRNNGVVTRVDFNGASSSQSDIFTGGSRGDFAAVDSQGCLYITQSSSVVRIGGSGQACAFEPTTPGPAPGARVIVSATANRRGAAVNGGGAAVNGGGATVNRGGGTVSACVRIQSLRLRIRQQGRVRLRSATVYVNGRRVKRLRGSAVTAAFTVSHLPRSSFSVKVVAVTTRGRKLVSRKRYTNCARPPAAKTCINTSRLTVRVPEPAGSPVVLVTAYVNGRRSSVVRGRRVAQVTLTRLPHGRFTVTLRIQDASGNRAASSQVFQGC